MIEIVTKEYENHWRIHREKIDSYVQCPKMEDLIRFLKSKGYTVWEEDNDLIVSNVERKIKLWELIHQDFSDSYMATPF